MPSILNLKFKGNKSFVAFSNLGDADSLTKTWKVCTKVASFLEQGSRLENLSWRLWHLQNLMVDTDNAKSKREFKKLSKTMSDKLDKEKGRSIEELEAPDFKRNSSTDMIRQRAEERERNREASQNAKPGTIKRMQFTFSVDQPMPAAQSGPVKKPNMKPSAEFKDSYARRTKTAARNAASAQDNTVEMIDVDEDPSDKDPPLTQIGRKPVPAARPEINAPKPLNNYSQQSLHFPSLFSDNFGPSALLYPTPTSTNSMTYGEGVGIHSSSNGFSIPRPTIELPLDEILSNVDMSDGPESWAPYGTHHTAQTQDNGHAARQNRRAYDINMSAPIQEDNENDGDDDASSDSSDVEFTVKNPGMAPMSQAMSQAVNDPLPQTIAPSRIMPPRGVGTGSSTPTGRPALTLRTQGAPLTRPPGPGATATSLNPAVLRQNGHHNTAPGGVKAECSNCGATHTPLWRRGLNDELNCNACGLYCKLHKRPRPKSMRNSHGEGRAQAAPRPETSEIMAQCYNCHTTATPLWRKDDEGKTVCNACGLYYKLHGSSRPISMKSDVIRKRSRHDARRGGNGSEDTPSASPGASRRATPEYEPNPIFAPDGSTTLYDFASEESDFQQTHSELMNALGPRTGPNSIYSSSGTYNSASFPGPYHPDVINQATEQPVDPLPFASVDASEIDDVNGNGRIQKRRRMSVDSASEPPSSAVSYSSQTDGYSSQSSVTSHSARSSLDYAYGGYPSYGVLRGSGADNAFWHPPMALQTSSPPTIHPPMLPPDDSTMDYLHPPMVSQDDENLFSQYLHPPMLTSSDDNPSKSPRPHPPMFPSEFGHGGQGNNRATHEFYDSGNMHAF